METVIFTSNYLKLGWNTIDKFLVFKEPVVLDWWERETEQIRCDAGQTLKMSAFQLLHGSNSTFVNSFDKT